MINKKIVFTAPWSVEVQEEALPSHPLAPDEALVRKKYTLISPGTELACLSGGEAWFHMPGVPGYAAVSEIVELGGESEQFAPGDLVFHYGNHSAYEVVQTSGVFLKVPEGLDPRLVPFTRMATVAFAAVRVAQIELGDKVAVTGLGLIGNMAAQLATLQGADVIGTDLSSSRLNLARKCGMRYGFTATEADLAGRIKEITGGNGVSTLIEATGVSKVAVDALPWIAPYGELVFLGSPRGRYETDVTDVFNYVHLVGRGCITFKGAHEWRYPVEPNPFVKHSLVRNSQIVFDLIQQNRLHIIPLISHTLKPEQAQDAYDGLKNRKDEYNGVLFDWS